MDSKQLAEPSAELAAKILTKVGFDDRLTAAMVHPHTGPIPITVYGFQEAANLLTAPGLHLDLKVLGKWIEEVMGDEELAARIPEAIEEGTSVQERAQLASALMQERLEQCRALLGVDTDGE